MRSYILGDRQRVEDALLFLRGGDGHPSIFQADDSGKLDVHVSGLLLLCEPGMLGKGIVEHCIRT